ncbi:beta strand repeat-containing protein [Methylomagnum ishizawai]|uniref:beta strand repeat-containing protein n=1 Tax=Methylomagnum ishizawai TaxID=1760988 RepID=UPI001C341FB9|nr:calcium-binding protein [Methylomagnum ishizawai]BBL74371.1 hypothetical protein MishRS11D_14690 [Methylomagnum ishizawai]
MAKQLWDGEDYAMVGWVGAQGVINGTSGNDTLNGTSGNDTLNGLAGNDTLYGNEGNDSLNGGAGNDTLYAGYDNDTLDGGAGDDYLSGSSGDDTYIFAKGYGHDTINESSDYAYGGNDILQLNGLKQADVAFQKVNAWDLQVTVKATGETVTIQNEFSTPYGDDFGLAIESLVFADGAALNLDQLNVLAEVGSAGNDTLWGWRANDTLDGGAGDDALYGSNGDDSLIGGTGNDELHGDFGKDTLSGGAGNDTLYAGYDNDTLDGGAGDDYLSGSSGDDTYIFAKGYGHDTINESSDYAYGGNDILQLNGLKQADVAFQKVNAWDLQVTVKATGETVTIQNEFSTPYGDDFGLAIESLVFADGTALTLDQLNVLADIGGSGDDTLWGWRASDTLSGNGGNDTLYGNEGNDSLNGGAGNDTLYGYYDNDTLDGGAGDDYLEGGDGNDTYQFSSGDGQDTINDYSHSDTVQFNNIKLTDLTSVIRNGDNLVIGYGATDQLTVQNQFSGDTGYRIETFKFTGSDTLTNFVIGDNTNNTLTGTTANDALNGLGGADNLAGGKGNDLYFVDNSADVITENPGAGTDTVLSSVNYTLPANVENLALLAGAATATGNSLANQITGNSANNTLDGGQGADILAGGQGGDTYLVDNMGDSVIENPLSGLDTIKSAIDYTLGANLENLILTGTALVATGNSLANQITGNSANNTLDGAQGADTLAGGAGNDVYTVDHTSDIIKENTGEGTDGVQSNVTYALPVNVETLILTGSANLKATGNSLANILTGNGGNNILDGAQGADSLVGGAGNDTYLVDNPGDVVKENPGAGTDTVKSALNHTLGANLENLILTGSAATGTGNSLANQITGNSGNNSLDGGTGADTLAGGAGDDTYVVDATGDAITENAGEGTDTVLSAIDYTLGANLENLILTGSAATGTGNSLANQITGNSGNNSLDGGTGADTLAGGAGNDTYSVDNPGDVVKENTGEGTDTALSAIDYALPDNLENLILTGTAATGTGNSLANQITGDDLANTLDGGQGADSLAGGKGADIYLVDNLGDSVVENPLSGLDTVKSAVAYTLGANLENLVLTSSAATGTGNSLANQITGNTASNRLDGGVGDDRLNGGAGMDSLQGGAGSDSFVFTNASGGADTVLDFLSGTDHLVFADTATGQKIGNGNHIVDGGVAVVGPGGFSNAAELVIVTKNIAGAITTASAAADIGSATSAYATGNVRLFAVDNGTDSALFLFKSAGADATVSAAELTLVGTLQGTASTTLADYAFA